MCFGGREKNDDEAGAARSRELDKMIRADEKRMAKEVKLLLLGAHPPTFVVLSAFPRVGTSIARTGCRAASRVLS